MAFRIDKRIDRRKKKIIFHTWISRLYHNKKKFTTLFYENYHHHNGGGGYNLCFSFFLGHYKKFFFCTYKTQILENFHLMSIDNSDNVNINQKFFLFVCLFIWYFFSRDSKKLSVSLSVVKQNFFFMVRIIFQIIFTKRIIIRFLVIIDNGPPKRRRWWMTWNIWYIFKESKQKRITNNNDQKELES